MSRTLPIITCACMALGVFAVFPAAAADEPSHRCALLDDDTARLACFDRSFPRPAARQPKHAPAPGPTPAPGPAPTPPAAGDDARELEEFGLTGAQLRARDPSRPDTRLTQFSARVVGIRYRSTGERILALDNGQTWLQTEVTVRGPLNEGDEVVIRRAALSSFMMVTPGGVALRVRRLE